MWKNALTAMAIHLGEKSAPSAVDERFMWIKKNLDDDGCGSYFVICCSVSLKPRESMYIRMVYM